MLNEFVLEVAAQDRPPRAPRLQEEALEEEEEEEDTWSNQEEDEESDNHHREHRRSRRHRSSSRRRSRRSWCGRLSPCRRAVYSCLGGVLFILFALMVAIVIVQVVYHTTDGLTDSDNGIPPINDRSNTTVKTPGNMTLKVTTMQIPVGFVSPKPTTTYPVQNEPTKNGGMFIGRAIPLTTAATIRLLSTIAPTKQRSTKFTLLTSRPTPIPILPEGPQVEGSAGHPGPQGPAGEAGSAGLPPPQGPVGEPGHPGQPAPPGPSIALVPTGSDGPAARRVSHGQQGKVKSREHGDDGGHSDEGEVTLRATTQGTQTLSHADESPPRSVTSVDSTKIPEEINPTSSSRSPEEVGLLSTTSTIIGVAVDRPGTRRRTTSPSWRRPTSSHTQAPQGGHVDSADSTPDGGGEQPPEKIPTILQPNHKEEQEKPGDNSSMRPPDGGRRRCPPGYLLKQHHPHKPPPPRPPPGIKGPQGPMPGSKPPTRPELGNPILKTRDRNLDFLCYPKETHEEQYRIELKDLMLKLLMSLFGLGVLLVISTIVAVKILDARKQGRCYPCGRSRNASGNRGSCCLCCHTSQVGDVPAGESARESQRRSESVQVEVQMSDLSGDYREESHGHSRRAAGNASSQPSQGNVILRPRTETGRNRSHSTDTNISDPPSYNEAMGLHPPPVATISRTLAMRTLPRVPQLPSYEEAMSGGAP